ncbi:FMN-binding protein [Oceanobacillus sojae]|uniref:FMN-binding protein n=1 Tax=Oceanobacillus sojae TaxID=582851 RepID=UPI00363052EA
MWAIALLGKQSEILDKPDDLDTVLKEKVNDLEKNPGAVSPAWTQYRVVAKEAEFWQAVESMPG